MLAGVLDRDRHVPAQSEAHARLAECAEVERLRESAHHGAGTRAEMGGGADSHGAHGRDCRARSCCSLALQGREGRDGPRRVADEHPNRPRGGRRPAGDGPVQARPLRRRGVCVHPEGRSAEVSEGCDDSRPRLPHTLSRGKHLRGGKGERQGGGHTPAAALGRHGGDSHAEHPEAAPGVAEHREDLACPLEDTPRPEGDAAEGRPPGEGDAGAQAEEQEDRILGEHPRPHHQEAGIQGGGRLL